MEETVLFNLGNLVASSEDEKELIRKAWLDSGKNIEDISLGELSPGFLLMKDPDSHDWQLIQLKA